MKKKIVFGLIATMLMASSAFAVKEGGGGDLYAIEFVETGNRIVSFLDHHPEALQSLPGLDLSAIKAAVKSTTVESTTDTLKLEGAIKDAINYPDLKKIVFNRKTWISTNDLNERAKLVLHEYVGVSGSSVDKTYQVSSRLVAIDFNTKSLACDADCQNKIQNGAGFTYSVAQNAFDNAQNPAGSDLVGVWLRVARASSPDFSGTETDYYDPSGTKNKDGSAGYLNLSPTDDFFGNTILTASYLNCAIQWKICGPALVTIKSDAPASFMPSPNGDFGGVDGEWHNEMDCKVVNSTNHLICAERLVVDDKAMLKNDWWSKRNGTITDYYGYVLQGQ